MKWSLKELNQASEAPIHFTENLDLNEALKSRRSDIIKVSTVHVDGMFSIDELGVLGYMKVNCTVTLPSSRSFQPVDLELNFDVTEHYLSHYNPDLSSFEDTDVVIVLKDDILNLADVIEDNILLQIPMQVLSVDEKRDDAVIPSGDDWSVIREEQLQKNNHKKDNIDPRLAKLKNFFDEDK